MELRQPTDLVSFTTGQLDELPESTQREFIEYLARHYHIHSFNTYTYPSRPDIPPRIPFPSAQNPHSSQAQT